MSTKKILVTGGTGFVGKALLKQLSAKGYDIIAPVRQKTAYLPDGVVAPIVEDICSLPEHSDLFNGCSVVIHVAAKAHVVGESLEEFRRVNTEATLNLATLAAKAGVKRFIFLSSIGVNGISNKEPFTSFDKPAPVENYAISKLEAEIGLTQLSEASGMEIVIIRPPLVYGPGAPGNFGKLIQLVYKNLPLPLGAIANKRSLVALDNLVDLIITCINHPNAANQTFLVSDAEVVSTTELLTSMILASGNKPRLLPIPMSWLKVIGRLTGKQSVIDRLCGDLQVDASHARNVLGWTPVITQREGIERCFLKDI
ncbi:UDP-glucose 4-epimerase family protein [Rheinheimera sp. MM224]|uniref:UDP-glucose 4-epimerase family protein n=1 Tax=Rheinheimera sp. MM224 TaxID=3019969 RepID=UPI0021F8B1F1|nr:SDR family oxidoreductase [Rheinheimera sp. MM224]